MEPEPTVLATELPDTMPSSALATTATLAGRRRRSRPRSGQIYEEVCYARPLQKAPKMINTTMNLAQTFTGVESTPWVE